DPGMLEFDVTIDLQNLGSLLGQCASDHRTGDRVRGAEDTDAAERAWGRAEGLRRALADLPDGNHGLAGEVLPLRMAAPLRGRACDAHGVALGVGDLLQLLGVPLGNRPRDAAMVGPAVEEVRPGE